MCRRLDRSQFSGIFEYVRCDPEISRIDEEYENARMYESFVALGGFLGHWSFFIAGRSKLDTRFLYCMDCLEESLWDV